MIIPVVNLQDEVIGHKERAAIDATTDIVRSASLWITNSKGEILLAQRSFSKQNNPGKWSEAVGGTVEGDDGYEQTMLREAQEELGVEVSDYKIGPKQYIDSPSKYFVQWFEAVVDQPAASFIVQKEELEQVMWLSKDRLLQDLNDHPENYIDEMQQIAKLFL